MKSKRLYGLDILRIMAMLSITAIHYVAYSGIMQESGLIVGNKVFLSSVSALFVGAVNLFVLITGYFSCEKNLNIKRLIDLELQVVFVGIITLLIGVFALQQPFRLTALIKTLFPTSSMHYWFFTMYIVLMSISPLINAGINRLTEKQYKYICIAGIFILCIFFVSNPFINAQYYVADARGIVWLAFIYFVGAGIKKYGLNFSKGKSLLGIVACFIVLFFLNFFGISNVANAQLLDGNSIIPFFMSLFLFFFFKDIDIKNTVVQKIISVISACSFLVYILQEHDTVRDWYWNWFNIKQYAGSYWLILNFLISLLVLWPIALLFHYLFLLIKPLIDLIYSRLSTKISAFTEKRKEVR